jgi:hypothetical protein
MSQRDEWRERARCATYPDPTLWDHTPARGYTIVDKGEIVMAKALCNRCPVIAQCLNDATEDGDVWTIRGGMTPAERYKAGLHPDWHALRWHTGNPKRVRRRSNP